MSRRHPMGAARARRLVNEALQSLALVGSNVTHARALLAEWSSEGFERGGGGAPNNGHGDPTAARVAAVVDAGGRVDAFLEQLLDFDRRLEEVHRLTAALATDARSVVTKVDVAQLRDVDGCWLCDQAGEFQPVYTRMARIEGGPKLKYCKWHHDFLETYGEDAAPELTSWHLEHPGEKRPKLLVREHHSAAFARVHGTNWAHGGKARAVALRS